MTEEIRVWLDDIRDEPAGWIRTKTVKDTIGLLESFNVVEISLDNDLGAFDSREGYEVLDYIEEQLAINLVMPPKIIRTHTGNPVALRRMQTTLKRINQMVRALEVQRRKDDANPGSE